MSSLIVGMVGLWTHQMSHVLMATPISWAAYRNDYLIVSLTKKPGTLSFSSIKQIHRGSR